MNKDSQTKQVEQPAKNEPVKGDDADKLIESAGEACMLIVGAYEGYQWERARSLELTASIMFEYAKAGYELSKAAPKGGDVFHGLDPNILCKPLGEVLKGDDVISKEGEIKAIREVASYWQSKFLALNNSKNESAPQAVKWVQASERATEAIKLICEYVYAASIAEDTNHLDFLLAEKMWLARAKKTAVPKN